MLFADFREFYGINLSDVWRGMLSVREVFILSEQLETKPESRYRAALLGGPQFIGWGTDRYLTADVRDMLLALLAGYGKQALTEDDWWPRPTDSRRNQKSTEVGTLADFDEAAFLRGDW